MRHKQTARPEFTFIYLGGVGVSPRAGAWKFMLVLSPYGIEVIAKL
jgi:hypothetical protein